MIEALRLIAERRISEAIRNGTLNVANWKGKPLPIGEDKSIPDDLRMAYKILKNAGYLPPEIETRKEISQLEELIAKTDVEHVKLCQIKKLNFLIFQLNTMHHRSIMLEKQEQYYERVTEKITVKRG